MNKFKFLAKNTAIFGISQFTSKIMVFLLLPLYTTYMTTEDYGNADLALSTISLLLPIFTLEVISAVMRFSIENKEKAKPFFSNGLTIIVIGFILLLILIPAFVHFHLFDGYLYLFYILYIVNALYLLLSYYARALEKIKIVGIVGVINTFVVVVSNIVFLMVLHKGLIGYLISYILGYFISTIILIVVLRKTITLRFFKLDKKFAKEMIKYSAPLVPNNVSWWGVSSANKYIIYGYLNKNILGLYSVALKIPTIINTIQSIIAEALVLSIFEEYNNENKDEKYFSLLYSLYSTFSIIITSLIIIFTKIISCILFLNEFYNAWIYVPLLCIPSVWGALSGYLGTFYAASKKNNGMFFSTALGGTITIVVSLLTVKNYGVYGIIVGNILAYFVIWLYRWVDVKRFVSLKVNMKADIVSWIVLLIQALIMILVDNSLIMYSSNFLLLVILIIVNKKTETIVIKKIKDIAQKRHSK